MRTEEQRRKRREYIAEWRKKNPEYDAEWRKSNRDKCREYSEKFRKNNPDKRREYEKRRREKNLDKAQACDRARSKRWREAHKEQCQERTRKWRAEHPGASTRNSKRWREENRAECIARREQSAARTRAWRVANLGRALQNQRNWKENNPDKIREYNRNRRIRLLSKDGRHTAGDIETLYQLQEGQCAGCNAFLQKSGPDRFHVDHIVPLFPKDGQPAGSNNPENLQLLCPRCNLSKSNLSQEQWDRREGRLR